MSNSGIKYIFGSTKVASLTYYFISLEFFIIYEAVNLQSVDNMLLAICSPLEYLMIFIVFTRDEAKQIL